MMNDGRSVLPFQTSLRLIQLREEEPQADFWFTLKELDLLILQFVKSCRSVAFTLYTETLLSLMPWVAQPLCQKPSNSSP